MDILERFQSYADTFEEACVDDDWSRLEQFFTEDAVYSSEPAAHGRAAVLEKLESGVKAFDHKMDARIFDTDKMSVVGNTVELEWKVTYKLAGTPDLTLFGVQLAVFDGDRIARLDGEMDAKARLAMGEWLAQNGDRLSGSAT